MDQINICGIQTIITVTPVMGGKRWTWAFHCENGISSRNSEEFCPSRAAAWDEARCAAFRVLQSVKK